MKMYFKIIVIVFCAIFLLACNQKKDKENNVVKSVIVKPIEKRKALDTISIRAFDEIFFGNINPKMKNDSARYNFFQHYRTEIAGVEFYNRIIEEKIDSEYGLYQFGLASFTSFDFAEAKKINLELKSIIEKKYSTGKKINVSSEKSNQKIHKMFLENINKSLPEDTPPMVDELGTPYFTFEYLWTKNNIQVMLGYGVEFKWIDKNNEILELDGTDISSRIKGQKKFYMPFLRFTHLGLQKRVWADDTKREQSFEKETKQLENKRRQKDSGKF